MVGLDRNESWRRQARGNMHPAPRNRYLGPIERKKSEREGGRLIKGEHT